ncbi:pyocin knob domain-containing protein [Stenotrophomonas rhizophila]|uniref:pyocin knob domain-containing protein n=1 Tax=Stenotrophomonas rhizophila TaxID=216778 RepID=UPI0035129546
MAIPQITITPAGRAALVNAEHTGTAPVRISHVGLTPQHFDVSKVGTTVPAEAKRITTFAGKAVAADLLHLNVRDDSQDTYTLRGFGLYLEGGVLFAVYSQPTPIMEKAAAATMLLATDIRFVDIKATSITVDKIDFVNPPATTTQVGVARFSTDPEAVAGAAGDLMVSPRGLAAYVNGRFGGGAPSEYVKTLLTKATAAMMRVSLEIKSAALRDEGHGNNLDADLLDGAHGAHYLDYRNLTNVPGSFSPAYHTHPIAQVDGLQAALSTKAPLADPVFEGNVTAGGSVIAKSGNMYADARGSANPGFSMRSEDAKTGAGLVWVRASDTVRLRTFASDGSTVSSELALGPKIFTYANNDVWHAGNFRPTDKADKAHVHATSEVTGLQDALNSKVNYQRTTADDTWQEQHSIFSVNRSAVAGATMPSPYTLAISLPTYDGSTGLALATYYGNQQRFWMRSRNDTLATTPGGRWKEWCELWHSANFDPATKANLTGANFSGAVTATTVRSTANIFIGGPVYAVLAPNEAAGEVLLRPNGGASTVGQLRVTVGGIAWNDKGLWHSGNFDPSSKANLASAAFTGNVSAPRFYANTGSLLGTSTHALLAPTAANGTVYLRPGGELSRAGELKLEVSGMVWNNEHVVWHAGNFQPAGKADKVHTHAAATDIDFSASLDAVKSTVYSQIPKGVTVANGPGDNSMATPQAVILTLNQSNFRVAQMALNTNSNDFYWRGYREDTTLWNPWRRIWHDGNFDPASKANASHTHTIAQVSGLQDALTARALLAGAAFTGNVTAPNLIAGGSGNGAFVQIGDDAQIVDIGVSNTVGLCGLQDRNAGGLKLGATGPTLASNGSALKVQGAFGATGGFDFGSSRKLKDIDGPVPYGLAEVERMVTAIGRYKADYHDDGRDRLFLIAEDLAALVPESVNLQGMPYKGDMVPSIKIDQLLPVLVIAIQQLSAKVRDLSAAGGNR